MVRRGCECDYEFAWELLTRWHSGVINCALFLPLSCQVLSLSAAGRTRTRTALALRCSQVHTPPPTKLTPTPTAINQVNALPLSDTAQDRLRSLCASWKIRHHCHPHIRVRRTRRLATSCLPRPNPSPSSSFYPYHQPRPDRAYTR
jgi:hypothetical protein